MFSQFLSKINLHRCKTCKKLFNDTPNGSLLNAIEKDFGDEICEILNDTAEKLCSALKKIKYRDFQKTDKIDALLSDPIVKVEEFAALVNFTKKIAEEGVNITL